MAEKGRQLAEIPAASSVAAKTSRIASSTFDRFVSASATPLNNDSCADWNAH